MTSGHHAPARRVGRGGCRATTVQRRLVAHTPQTAAVPGDPTARCRAARASGPTDWCCTAHASNMAEQQDVTATVALKASLATPRQ
jgi:hypothetical protein